MNRDKLRRQSLKIIISESLMVFAVICIVSILAFIVSGYWVNSDFELERQGMLQISSVPTGAEVEIDGVSSWLQRTNTSKVLTAGEHSIKLSKEGYDTWSKTINITDGLLYRIHYPRLFLKDRKTEKLLNTTGDVYATVSPDKETLILINKSTEWTLVKLNDEKLNPKKIDIAKYFLNVSVEKDAKTGLFSGKIAATNWSKDGNRVLFRVNGEKGGEWVLLDVDDAKKSVNLTKEFGSDFSKVEILDNAANNLLAVQKNKMHKIDISSKAISAVLVDNVINFDHFENEVIFSARRENNQSAYIGLFKIGENKVKTLESTDSSARVLISRFYDDKYITVLEGRKVSLYRLDGFVKVDTFEISFDPSLLEVGHAGEYIIFARDEQIATLDMEAMKMIEWSLENKNYDWLDNDMLYVVDDGELIVYDYDGLNRRVIAKNASESFPVMITNNRWLYYFSDNKLVREVINE